MSRLVDYKTGHERDYEIRGGRAIYVISLLFLLLLGRLVFLQVLRYDRYARLAGQNHIRVVPKAAARGLIYDRGGELLVKNTPSYELRLVPGEITDVDMLLSRLARLAGVDSSAIREKLSLAEGRAFQPVPVLDGLELEAVARLEERREELPGMMVGVKPRRFYVYGNYLSHVLGHIGPVSKRDLQEPRWADRERPFEEVGKSGVEKQYDELLRGVTGGTQVEVDSLGRHLRVLADKPAELGNNLYLTIDFKLQRTCEQLLEGVRGAVVALDPNNGELLAMASKPDYDPNEFASPISSERWQELSGDADYPLQNRCVQGEYPPGSIYKIVTAAAVLESKALNPYQTYLCQGVVNFRDWPYRCWKENGHGWTDMNKALIESCDIYFYRAGVKTKVDALNRYSVMFGLGNPCGVDLPGEKAGLVPSAPWKRKRYGRAWYYGNTIQMSIGQGFLLSTPLQLACLMSAVANDGVLYRPHLLREVRSPDGVVQRRYKPQVISTLLIAERTLKIFKRALVGVVSARRGTGGRARLRSVSVAGKTATSENPQGEPHAAFGCYAPSDKPRLVLLVFLENAGEGGRAAAPIAKYILEDYFGLKHSLSLDEVRQIVAEELGGG